MFNTSLIFLVKYKINNMVMLIEELRLYADLEVIIWHSVHIVEYSKVTID